MSSRLRTASLLLALAPAIRLSGRAWAWHQAPAPAPAAGAHAPRRAVDRGIERRVRFLTKVLELDPRQQAELRSLLQRQREQIRRVWSDPSLSAADHVGATRAILDATASRIRALLTEEQRKRYPAPRSPRAPSPAPPDVEYWLRLTERKGGEAAGRAN